MPFYPLINKETWEFFGDRLELYLCFVSVCHEYITGNPVIELPGERSDFLIVENPTIPAFEYGSVQWNLCRLPYAEKRKQF